MEDGIELDDIRVVNVTGTVYKDRRPRGKKSGCSGSPSLRVTTILLFLFIALLYLAAVAVFIVRMRVNLEDLDREASKQSVDRFTSLFFNDIVKLKQLTRKYAWSQVSADAVRDPKNETAMAPFVNYYFNTTMDFDAEGNIIYTYSVSSLINYWALIDNTTFRVVASEFHPAQGADLAGKPAVEPQPIFPPEYLRNVLTGNRIPGTGPMLGWMSLFAPILVPDPMFVSIEAIMIPNDAGVIKDPTIYGYLMTCRTIKNRLSIFADDVPGCISMISNNEDLKQYDNTDMDKWEESVPGVYKDNKFSGDIAFAQRETEYLDNCSIRVCPAVPLFNATDKMMTSYFKLCGIDPKIAGNQTTCINFRMDRSMSMVEQGTTPVINVSIEVVVIMVVLCVAFLIFLDFVVLRRIAALSDVIRKQTRGHREATKDVEDDTATASVAAADRRQRSRGKRGRSARSGGDTSTVSSEGGDAPVASPRDELGNLKRVMEQNALGLRKRLEAVNESIKIESQRAVRHKQAMQLLNLWCGRKDYFPGLRPNAMQLRYEPTRSLDDLLANPLAIEYLKSHCDTDRTLENLWFLLDVSWLEELEAAEDNEDDAEKRKQIHEVAEASAMTILARYIAVNAPQQINISAGTFKSLREKGDVYQRKMFEDAVSEVKLMLNTDILPRFQKSAAYSAMSETLFIDNSGGGDESEFSDETVSTAGSILTDEGDENEGGVARVFAHTFKNLHNTFDANPDTDNSSTYSADSSRATNTLTSNAPPTASIVAGTETTTTAGQDKGTSGSKDGSSVSSDEVDEKKQPPKAVELGRKEAPAKKDESDSSSDSSDSSSHSISSDSMTMSGSDSSSSSD